jgi:tetratricopeptide (TPR) repeat protein
MRTITAADASQISRIDYLLTQFTVITLYLKLLIFPIGQNIDHDISVQHSLFSPAVLGSLFLLIALLSCAGYAIKRSHRTTEPIELNIFSFGILWFFITLSVESSIIPLGELSAEYRLYLPSIGIILAVVSLFAAAMRKFALNRVVILSIATSLVILVLVATLLRVQVWQSEVSIWRDATLKSPARARPYLNLGVSLVDAGRLVEAVPLFERSVAIDPEDPFAWNDLGAALNELGRPNDSISALEHAIANNPIYPEAYYNMGRAYLSLKDYTAAINYFSKAISFKPSYSDAYNMLAVAYNRVGRYGETIRLLEGAYRQIYNHAEGHFNLCVAYFNQGKRSCRGSCSRYQTQSTSDSN